jgi:hypothetical protein
MRLHPTFARLLALAGLAACAELPTEPAAPDAPTAPVEGVLVYLSLSSLTPQAGDRVTIAVNALRAVDAEAIGSFTLRVAYDTTALRLVATELSKEGLVMGNAARGVVTIAGASGDGFRATPLATLTMDVMRAGALSPLALSVDEMNATSFRDQRASTTVDRRQYARPLTP